MFPFHLTLRGEFHSPKGICFDHANRIIVADCNNNRIQGFEYLEEAGGSYSIQLHPGIAPNHKKGGILAPSPDNCKTFNHSSIVVVPHARNTIPFFSLSNTLL